MLQINFKDFADYANVDFANEMINNIYVNLKESVKTGMAVCIEGADRIRIFGSSKDEDGKKTVKMLVISKDNFTAERLLVIKGSEDRLPNMKNAAKKIYSMLVHLYRKTIENDERIMKRGVIMNTTWGKYALDYSGEKDWVWKDSGERRLRNDWFGSKEKYEQKIEELEMLGYVWYGLKSELSIFPEKELNKENEDTKIEEIEDTPVIKSIDIDDIDDKTIKEAIIEGVEDYYSQIECGDYMIEFRDDGVKIIGDGTIQATCSFDMSEMSDERGVKVIKEWIKENIVNLLEDVKEYDLKTKDYIKTCIEKGLKLGTFCVEDNYHPVIFSPCGVKVMEYRNNNRLSDDMTVVDEIALDMNEMTDEKGIDIIADWIFNVFKKLMIKAKKDYYKSLKMLENPFECEIA